jgi:hypothetical protein
VFRDIEETDLWKKPEAENLVSDSSIPLTFVRRNSTVRIDVLEEKEKKQLYCIGTVVRKEVM